MHVSTEAPGRTAGRSPAADHRSGPDPSVGADERVTGASWRAAAPRTVPVPSRPAPGWAAGTSAVEQYRAQIACAQILDNAGIRPGDHVLNLGDETGLLTGEALHRVGRSGRVSTVASQEPRVRQTRPVPGGGIVRWVGTDPCAVDLVSASVQVVVGNGVFAYQASLREVMAEAARVLRVGGRLSVCEPIHAGRRMDVDWEGIGQSEVAFIHAMLRDAVPGLAAAYRFTERGIVLAGQIVGLDAGLPRVDWVTVDLREADAVKAYLVRPVVPGGAPLWDVMRKTIRGDDLLTRYERSLFLGAEKDGVRITMPVMALTAIRRERTL